MVSSRRGPWFLRMRALRPSSLAPRTMSTEVEARWPVPSSWTNCAVSQAIWWNAESSASALRPESGGWLALEGWASEAAGTATAGDVLKKPSSTAPDEPPRRALGSGHPGARERRISGPTRLSARPFVGTGREAQGATAARTRTVPFRPRPRATCCARKMGHHQGCRRARPRGLTARWRSAGASRAVLPRSGRNAHAGVVKADRGSAERGPPADFRGG